MAASIQTSVNLGLSGVPEISDPKLFPEFVRIYNAIKILAQSVDLYTGEGSVTTQVETLESESTPAEFAELRKTYYKYTVPTFTVKGKFACNGQAAQAAIVINKTSGSAPAGGVGTAAGAWDTAANRDLAIAAIKANADAITEIQNILKQFGLGKAP